jgi:SNF2 family DNA or RNA helicase
MYKEMTSKTRLVSSGGGVTADALTTLTNLRKLCSHPNLNNNESTCTPRALALSGKLLVLNSLLDQIRKETPDDKIVIVSNFTSALSLIEESVLQPRNLSYQRLDGSTDLTNRQNIVDTFNKTSAERNFVFLLSSKAGGCGLNLIGANRLVMFDPDW